MEKRRIADPDSISFRQLTPPLVAESILRTTVGVVNAAFLSRIDSSAVSAVNTSTQYINLCQIIATAVATGTVVCLNQAIGSRNRKNIDKYATIAFTANLVMGLIFGLLFFLFSGAFLSIMDFSPALRGMTLRYIRLVGSFMSVQCVQIIISNINRSTGRTKAPLVTNLVINLVNILGCWLVVTGRALGGTDPIIGVAIANVASQFAGLATALIIFSRSGVSIRLSAIRPFPWKDLKLSLSIGIPAGLNNIAYSSSQIVTTSIISMTTPLMLDAKQYIQSIIRYAALLGQAFAQSAVIMIGYRIGAGKYEEADRLRKKVTRIALISNFSFSILLLLCYRPLLNFLYGNADNAAYMAQIIEIASVVMMIDVVVELGRALNNTLSGALQATGDVTFQLIVNQASGWLIAVGGAWLFGIKLDLGLYGIWIAFALDECTRGSILLYRWRSHAWVEKARMRTGTINS